MGLETAAIIGIAAAGAATVGSVANVIATNDANKQNARNVADTNAMNYQIFQEQKAYQTGEREATQEYNTPLNQRLRFEQAGINPYMALGNITSGVSTAQSSPSASPMQAAQVQPLPWGQILDALSNNADKYLQFDAMQMDNESRRVELQFKVAEKIADLTYKRQQAYNSKLDGNLKAKEVAMYDEQISIAQEELKFLRSTQSERSRQVQLINKQYELDNKAKELSNDYQTWLNDFAKKRGDKEMQQLDASIKAALASANASNAVAAASLSQKVVNECQAKGIKIDNYQKNKINWIIREGLKLDNKAKKYGMNSYFGREVAQPLWNVLDDYTGSNKQNPFLNK